MRNSGGWLGVMAIVLVFGGAANAAEAPLMVAAEVEAGVGLDAQDVRRAIAGELHREVVAPAAAPGIDAPNILLVSVDRVRTVVSFRAPSDEHASRAIPTPPDRAGRLRAVAWLAGNLARDQVSPLVLAAAQAQPTPIAAASGDVPAAARPSSEATSPLAAAAIEPPAMSAAPHDARADGPGGGALGLWATPAVRSLDDPTWTVTASAGEAAEYGNWRARAEVGDGPLSLLAPTFSVEAERHRLDGWLLGGALDFGPRPDHLLGFAVTGGLEQRWRGFRFEETLGLGLESSLGSNQLTQTTTSSLTGVNSQTTTTSTPQSAAYARVFVAASHPVWRAWDVVARLGVHTNLAGTLDDAFVASSLGLRLRVP